MECSEAPELTAFRDEVRAFIEHETPKGWTHRNREIPSPSDRDAARHFCEKLANRGLLVPHWPSQYGGKGASLWHQVILSEEMWAAGEPRGPQYLNVNWIGPAIMLAGTEDQKTKHLSQMAKGSVFWCQGFSEPDAGSDLASIRTTASRVEDGYILNGQKVWTSYAHAADYCFLLARTAPHSGPVTRSLSIFLLPMKLPGIQVREVRSPFGEHLLNEVNLLDVYVPSNTLLGEENAGWPLVKAALAKERIGVVRQVLALKLLDELRRRVGLLTLSSGHQSERQIGSTYAAVEAWRTITYVAAQGAHETSLGRPMVSLVRALTGECERRLADVIQDLLGPEIHFEQSDLAWQLTNGIAASLTAGATEIHLNAVARQFLGLPAT